MNPWAAYPLGVALACLLITWLLNRRPKLTGVSWPAGLALAGSLERPDLDYDGDVVLAGAARFGTVRCRRLFVPRGADVIIETVVAARVRVDGRLTGVHELGAGKRVEIRGELVAEAVVSPRIMLRKRSRANVLTIGAATCIDRHPLAEVKGFFTDGDELQRAGLARKGSGKNLKPAPPRTLTSGPISVDCATRDTVADRGEDTEPGADENDSDHSITVLSPRTRISKA